MLALASSCQEPGVFVCICLFISQQRDSDGRQTRVGLSPKMTLVVLLVTCTSKVLKKSIPQCFVEKPNRERCLKLADNEYRVIFLGSLNADG